jgi:nucleotide-binding universal stress UspA family protein
MKKILFATDFSEDAATAFEFAILLTQKTNGELLIIHTYTPPYVDPATPVSMLDTMYTEIINSYKKQLEKRVNTAKEIGISVSSELKISDVLHGIKDTIKEKNIDYLVIGKTGATSFLSKLIGSNANNLINHVKIPTFVIPSLKRTIIHVKSLLYGTQLEFDEITHLASAFEVAQLFSAKMNLVHVKAPNETDIRNDGNLLNDIQSNFSNESFTIETIKADNVEQGLKAGINLFHSDMLVVCSHGRSFLTQLVNPSKSQKLADTVNVPLLVLHFEDY